MKSNLKRSSCQHSFLGGKCLIGCSSPTWSIYQVGYSPPKKEKQLQKKQRTPKEKRKAKGGCNALRRDLWHARPTEVRNHTRLALCTCCACFHKNIITICHRQRFSIPWWYSCYALIGVISELHQQERMTRGGGVQKIFEFRTGSRRGPIFYPRQLGLPDLEWSVPNWVFTTHLVQ